VPRTLDFLVPNPSDAVPVQHACVPVRGPSSRWLPFSRWLLGVVPVALGACGEASSGTPAPQPVEQPAPPSEPSPPGPPSQQGTPAAPTPAASCASVGLARADVISAAARDANAAALAHHAAGRYTESEAGFRAAMEASPDYRSARFNHACALARLGRVAEAWSELEGLLCADLPSFAPRLRTDPDLASVRAEHEVDAVIASIAARYRDVARAGTPLVAFEHGPELDQDQGVWGTAWEESQAGVWLDAAGVFVPMGPRHHVSGVRQGENEALPLPATRYDPATGHVMSVLARGNLSEGGGLTCALELRLTEGATGSAIVTQTRRAPDVTDVRAWPEASGLVVSWLDANEQPFAVQATADGVRTTQVEPRAVDHVSIGNVSWQPVELRSQPAPGSRLTLESGTALELGRAPSWGERRVVFARDASVVFVVTSRHGDCGSRDRFLVERLVVETGQRVELWAGEDAYPILEEGADGALYIQAGDETRRFPDLGATGAAGHRTLRPGLGLTSSAHDVNPYC